MKPTLNEIKRVLQYLDEEMLVEGSFEDVIEYVNKLEDDTPAANNLKDFFVQQSNETENTEEQITNEIVEAFSAYVSSGKLDENIKQPLDVKAKQERHIKKTIEFWPYYGATSFRGFGFVWTNPSTAQYDCASLYYKHIELETIAERVVQKMYNIVNAYLSQRGFHVTFNIVDRRIGIKREVIISW